MDTIGVGMIGTGFMGLTYSEVVANQVPGARLAAMTGGRRAQALADDYSVECEASVEALLAREDVKAVVLATPDHLREEHTLLAAAAGKHVLAEKPMAPTVAACDRMMAACQSAGVHLGVVKTERYRKITQQAKEYVDSGAIGPLRMMRTVSAFPLNLTRGLFRDREWMSDPRSGGLFMGMASHNADFLRWMSGRNAVKVFAQVNTFSDLPSSALSVMAQIQFADGLMAHMWISSELPAPSLPSSEVRFQFVGADGMLDLENFEFLELGKGDSWERVAEPERFDYLKEPKSPIRLYPHIGVVTDFIDSIQRDSSPPVGGVEGRAAVEICEACLISARIGQAVDLPLGSAVGEED